MKMYKFHIGRPGIGYDKNHLGLEKYLEDMQAKGREFVSVLPSQVIQGYSNDLNYIFRREIKNGFPIPSNDKGE